MDGEQGRHEEAPADRPGGPRQKVKQHDRRRRVQEQVGQAEPGGRPAIQLLVQHQRKPGQGMPERGVQAAERPPHAVRGQPREHMRVCRDVQVVVELDEPVAQRAGEDGQHHGGQQQVEEQEWALSDHSVNRRSRLRPSSCSRGRQPVASMADRAVGFHRGQRSVSEPRACARGYDDPLHSPLRDRPVPRPECVCRKPQHILDSDATDEEFPP